MISLLHIVHVLAGGINWKKKNLSEKSDKNLIMTLILIVLLFVYQGVEGDVGEMVIKENDPATINCNHDLVTSSVFWFRMKENGFEYIGLFSKSKKKGTAANENKFTISEKCLQLNSFESVKDSGTYSSVSINNNELLFTCTTKLRGETVPTTIKPKIPTTPKQALVATPTPALKCPNNPRENKTPVTIDVLLGCEQHIFIPLAAGCGFLLLLLVITIVYCNRIRTRRCPHHYKRRPRSRPAGHKTLPNPPDF
ncbi:T-cell surface glycoprotein CD8 alpha chain [Tachysurus fulvidraco]|uniref:T-cell surface glycoprotein CD8 alpha chain n=1 Tax=Tachysurus fulvidraco TaxID=1234273 RepID=UPI001FEDE21C|nr:T-cell surface glycoprotein CD8 alpha chain [Tachysurus fulvidraco]